MVPARGRKARLLIEGSTQPLKVREALDKRAAPILSNFKTPIYLAQRNDTILGYAKISKPLNKNVSSQSFVCGHSMCCLSCNFYVV